MKVKIIELNKTSPMGRIYREENLTLIREGLVFESLGAGMTSCVGKFEDCHIEDGWIVADISVLPKLLTSGMIASKYFDNVEFSPSGFGILDKDKVIKDYKMESILVYTKESEE